jgi:hypothetical protein
MDTLAPAAPVTAPAAPPTAPQHTLPSDLEEGELLVSHGASADAENRAAPTTATGEPRGVRRDQRRRHRRSGTLESEAEEGTEDDVLHALSGDGVWEDVPDLTPTNLAPDSSPVLPMPASPSIFSEQTTCPGPNNSAQRVEPPLPGD